MVRKLISMASGLLAHRCFMPSSNRSLAGVWGSESNERKKLPTTNKFVPISSAFIGALVGAFDAYYKTNGAVFRTQFKDTRWNNRLPVELRDTIYLIVGDLIQTLATMIDCSKHSLTINSDLSNLLDLISVTVEVPNAPHLRYVYIVRCLMEH